MDANQAELNLNEEAVAPEQAMNLWVEEKADPLFARMVSASSESVALKLREFEARGIEVANSLAIEVKDQESYDRATMAYLNGKDFAEEVTQYVEPARKVAYSFYQKVLNIKKVILDATEKNLGPLGSNIKRFEQAKAEEGRRRQMEADAKHRKEEEDRKLALAQAAQDAGLSPASVEHILDTPSTAPSPVVAPSLATNPGMGKTRDKWIYEATEPDPQKSLLMLVKAAAKNPKAYLPYLQLNDTALGAHARAVKTAMDVPGYKAVNEGTLTRARR